MPTNIIDLIVLFSPLLMGYCLHIKNHTFHKNIDLILFVFIMLILFFMGCDLALLDGLFNLLPQLLGMTLVLFILTFGLNFLILAAIDIIKPWKSTSIWHQQSVKIALILFESIKVLTIILIGFICGLLFPKLTAWEYNSSIIKISLLSMLFFIGIQLRTSNLSIKHILLNRKGIMTTMIVIISCLLGGFIFSLIYKLPNFQGLAMASGYGFYSLSGSLIKEAYGPLMGNVTLLNDVLREVVALTIIPLTITRFKYATLGVSGATSMDFTLPMLTRGAGLTIVAPAIVQGFLLSLLPPIIISIFAAI